MSNGLDLLKQALRSKGLRETASQVAGAAIVGGPVGAAAAVLGKVAEAVGAPQGASVEDLAGAVRSASPEQLATLEAIEREKTQRMEIAAESSKDARSKFGMDRAHMAVGGVIVAGNIGMVAGLMFVPIPAGNENVLFSLSGILAAALVSVVNYYFGSSSGSSDKAKTIDAMLRR